MKKNVLRFYSNKHFTAKKVIAFFLVLLFTNELNAAQIGPKDSVLFENTIKLISEKQKGPGIRDELITNNIIKIVFETSDSIISLEEKLDLIILVYKFEIYAYRVLCNKVTHEYSTNKSINQSNKLLLIPFCNCEFAIKPILLQMQPIDSVELSKEIEKLSVNYYRFFKSLEKRIMDISQNRQKEKPYFIDYYSILWRMDYYYYLKYPSLYK